MGGLPGYPHSGGIEGGGEQSPDVAGSTKNDPSHPDPPGDAHITCTPDRDSCGSKTVHAAQAAEKQKEGKGGAIKADRLLLA